MNEAFGGAFDTFEAVRLHLSQLIPRLIQEPILKKGKPGSIEVQARKDLLDLLKQLDNTGGFHSKYKWGDDGPDPK